MPLYQVKWWCNNNKTKHIFLSGYIFYLTIVYQYIELGTFKFSITTYVLKQILIALLGGRRKASTSA